MNIRHSPLKPNVWPNIHTEVILLDFLFNPENKIPKHIAAYIIILLMDLQEDYRNYIKRGFIKYLLKSPYEQKRLQLVPEPPLYPNITIKAPVPWKCSVQVAKNRLEQILMVNHPVVQAINLLWHNLYNNLVIVDSATFFTGDVSFHAEVITDVMVEELNSDVRKYSNNTLCFDGNSNWKNSSINVFFFLTNFIKQFCGGIPDSSLNTIFFIEALKHDTILT